MTLKRLAHGLEFTLCALIVAIAVTPFLIVALMAIGGTWLMVLAASGIALIRIYPAEALFFALLGVALYCWGRWV